MNESFVKARTIFDRMMEDSLAIHSGCKSFALLGLRFPTHHRREKMSTSNPIRITEPKRHPFKVVLVLVPVKMGFLRVPLRVTAGPRGTISPDITDTPDLRLRTLMALTGLIKVLLSPSSMGTQMSMRSSSRLVMYSHMHSSPGARVRSEAHSSNLPLSRYPPSNNSLRPRNSYRSRLNSCSSNLRNPSPPKPSSHHKYRNQLNNNPDLRTFTIPTALTPIRMSKRGPRTMHRAVKILRVPCTLSLFRA